MKDIHVHRSLLYSTRQIHCKFFKRGEGLCPFGSKCFYLHVDKHGHAVELGPPRRRQRINARGELENFSDVFMVSVFSDEDFGRFFDEYVVVDLVFVWFFILVSFVRCRYDFLFDDEDDESHHSNLTDEDDFRFADENNFSDNENDEENWPTLASH